MFLTSDFIIKKTCVRWGMVAQIYNPSTSEVEAKGSQIQGLSWLQSEFQANLSYTMKYCFKKKEREEGRGKKN
jgi:hypothetical protein